MILDVNNDKTGLFKDAPFSVHNLKSFAFFGDQLFGIDMETKQHLNHWNLSNQSAPTMSKIPLSILSSDLSCEDSVYPIRLEAHNGFLYLFQRFESAKGIEVSKISYFDGKIKETGMAWQYSSGHENLFEDFAKIHGFVFDPNMKKYFMFSDIEIILNEASNEEKEDEADFFIDSDFKFKTKGSDEWVSSYHVKIPIIIENHAHFVNLSDPMVAHLDYSNNFVYFPLTSDQYHDSLCFLEFKAVKKGSIVAKFHKLKGKRTPFGQLMDETLLTMDGITILQVVSGQDIAIQHAVHNHAYNISNEQELDEAVEKHGNHKWAEGFYKILNE